MVSGGVRDEITNGINMNLHQNDHTFFRGIEHGLYPESIPRGIELTVRGTGSGYRNARANLPQSHVHFYTPNLILISFSVIHEGLQKLANP
jgi:hypothetical protein